jgi:hypothetical protein
MTRIRTIVALGVIAVLAFAPAAFAATLHVTSEAEQGSGTLGQVILAAGPGDIIEVPAGSYPLTHGDVLVAQANTIHGAGEGVTTIVPTGGGEAITSANVVDATIAAPEHPKDSESTTGTSSIEPRAQIIAVVVVLAIFLLILDLVRRSCGWAPRSSCWCSRSGRADST